MQILLKLRPCESFDSFANKTIINLTAGRLSDGSVAILPTSTIFGLSCLYDSKDSIKRIYDIKKRPASSPFIVLISRTESLGLLVAEITQPASLLIRHFWESEEPKPLTLVFKKNRSLLSFITSGSPNIAVRLDPLLLLRKIIDLCGPLVSTSATVSGSETVPAEINDIDDEIKSGADIVLDPSTSSPAGLCSAAPPVLVAASTILDVTGDTPVILREGELKADFINRLTGIRTIGKDGK